MNSVFSENPVDQAIQSRQSTRDFFYQCVAADALQHVHLPGLRIGARRRPGSQFKQMRDDIARYGRWQKVAR